MKRTVIWSLVAVTVVSTLLTLWFLQNFEQAPSSHWEAAQKEARRNPYLALERLFGQLGRPVTRLESPGSLDALTAGGALILDENRRRNVDPARAGRLLNWVQGGGYLIVAAEDVGDDPLLAKLGVSHYKASPSMQCPAEGTVETPLEKPAENTPPAKPGIAKPPAPIEFRLPGSDTSYRFNRHGNGLTSSSPEPEWRAGLSDERNAVLHYTWGQGRITVLDGLQFLNNRQIGNLDHAELIWALLQQYQPQGELRLASRMEVPTLWQWLIESAWMLLISAALLITLWLWRIIPRFGGTLATPVAERRDLVQHLAAIGRSVWREGGITHWLSVVRQAVHKRLALRHPYLFRQEASEQRIALARIAGCKTKDIQSALTSGQALAPDDFTLAMQTLQRLDQRL
jgi:hypothetical protein